MTQERIMASVTLKSRRGLSVYSHFTKLSPRRIDEFRPRTTHIDQTANLFAQAGFTIEAQTEMGISISGAKELFAAEFNTKLTKKRIVVGKHRNIIQKVSYFAATQTDLMSARVSEFVETVRLAVPGVPFHLVNAPNPAYYWLDVANDVPAILNTNNLHAAGTTGAGVRISMVDSGFVTRVTEQHISSTSTRVVVNHEVWGEVQGVWLATDVNHTGTNYYTGGNFINNVLTLGTPLPSASVMVEIVYSCLHPHYTNHGYTIDDIRTVGGLDLFCDGHGHGGAEAANVLAMAPGATFSFVKAGENFQFTHAGFQAAVADQNPDIITCSWGTGGINNALYGDIANAVANGIVVIFAAGNGHTDNPGGGGAKAVAHPDLISVGGAYPIQGGGFRASNYASSYDSFIFTNPQRHCPDIVGLVGEQPGGILIMLPTEPGNIMDSNGPFGLACGLGENFPDCDETGTDDGWCVCSGTSASAPQTAGLAALLLQRFPGLSPMAIKNILENSSRDIITGLSNNDDNATAGWDAATGFGLIDSQAALNYLQPDIFNAFIRDSIMDNGTEPVVTNRLWASPDIIVRSEAVDDPQDELGQTVKHRYDLCDEVEDGQTNYIYLRVQNRGTLAGDCTADVYFTDPGMFANPANWIKVNGSPVAINDLQPGEFRVVGPIEWNDTDIPNTGHFCLIAILDSTADPAPDLTTINSINAFTQMVRDRNNVAWKNIQIEDVVPGGSSSFSFYMEGPQGTWHQANLEVDCSGFPAGGQVLVKVVKRLVDTATLNNMDIANESAIYTTLNHHGGIGRLEGMDFKSNERTKVTVYYQVPESTADGDYPIRCKLFIDGNDEGGYTEVVRVAGFAFVGNRNTRELHRKKCPWIHKMSSYNKIPFGDIRQAHRRGFDNCAYCIGDSKR